MGRRLTVRTAVAVLAATGGLLLSGCASARPGETQNESTPGPPLPSVSIAPPTYTASPTPTPAASATPSASASPSASPTP